MADHLIVGNVFFFSPHESCTKRIAASSSLAGFHREPNYRSRRSERRSSLVANGVGTSDVNDDDFDPWMAWAYRPRTISLLLIGACLLMGVWAMIAVCLAYSLLQAPLMILIRLHPALGA